MLGWLFIICSVGSFAQGALLMWFYMAGKK